MDKIIKSKKNVIILSFISILIVSQLIPFLSSKVESNIFMGIPFNVVDTNNYFSFMHQAKEGNLLFTNKFTSEKIPYIILQPVFLVMGWFTFLLPPIFVYFLFKFVFFIIFALLVYKLLELIAKKDEMDISAIFVLFGSGIGYIFLLLSNLGFKRYGSIDYWLSESNSIGLNIAPVHFIVSVCLMIVIVIFYYKFWQSKKISDMLVASFLTLLLGFIHLFDVITLIAAFAVYMLWRLIKKRDSFSDILKYNLIYGAVIALPFIYTYYLFAVNPLFKEWDAQNVLETPKFLHVLFGYFFPLVFAFVYFLYKATSRKKFEDFEIILFGWMFSGLVLLYSPLNIQRRFIEGLNLPIMILGALGFLRVILPIFVKKMQPFIKIKNLKTIGIILALVLITPTSFYWLYKTNANVSQNIEIGDYSVPFYLDKDELEALKWLKENSDGEEVVLSAYGIGNYIPRVSGNRVYLGHWAQTINFEKRKMNVIEFYSGDDTFRKGLLGANRIDYVYYGIEEKKIGSFKPDYMENAFENKKVTIYKIK